MKVETDNHKLMYHPERVSEWLRSGDCFPVYVEIGVTNRCNHRCIFCALDWVNRKHIDIDPVVLIRTIKDMAEYGVKSLMFAGEGEPLLHPDFCDFVTKSKEFGLDIALSTNGVMLNSEKLNIILPCLSWIRYSVDASSKESHSLIHGTTQRDFQKIIKNIRDAVYIKKKNNLMVTIGVQMLIISENIHEVVEFISFCNDIGVDNVQLKPYSQHPLSHNKYAITSDMMELLNNEIAGIEYDNLQIIFRKKTAERLIQSRSYDECHGLPFYALIEADGNIIPCNLFHNNEEFSYGNLNNNSFSEIWRSNKRKDVISKIKSRNIDDCRKGCRLDAVNRYLQDLRTPHPHINFI